MKNNSIEMCNIIISHVSLYQNKRFLTKLNNFQRMTTNSLTNDINRLKIYVSHFFYGGKHNKVCSIYCTSHSNILTNIRKTNVQTNNNN